MMRSASPGAASPDETVTHYAILRRNRDTDDLGVFHVIEADAGPGLAYTDRTVAAEGSYVYRVKAVSPTGVSQWSGYARADTPAAPQPTATPTPTSTPEPTPTPEPETAEVTATQDATGENPPASPTDLQFSSAAHDAVNLTWRRHRTRPSPTTPSCAATGTPTTWASST